MSPLLFQVLGWIAAACCLIGALAAILLIIAHYWYKYHPDNNEPVDIFYEDLSATIFREESWYVCTCLERNVATYFYNVDEEEAIELGQKWLKELSKNS